LPGLLRHRGEENLRVLVAGGDGTFHAVLHGMMLASYDPLPPAGIIPMGTGNDLARQFGWGRNFIPKRKRTLRMLCKYAAARTTPMDVWKVKITPFDKDSHLLNEEESRVQPMFNYFNMGFEAKVSLLFDQFRKKHPKLLVHRRVNQIFYTYYAARCMVQDRNTPLASCIDLEVDQKRIELPPKMRTLAILNFKSYQAGLDLWGTEKGRPPVMNDKVAEVAGIGGVRHEMKIRAHWAKGTHLGQGSIIVIDLLQDTAINYDGEPVLQNQACQIVLTPWTVLPVLTRTSSPEFENSTEQSPEETPPMDVI